MSWKKVIAISFLMAFMCSPLIYASQYRKIFEEKPSYTPADKKIFDDLVDVWYTKRAGGERKAQRIKDLTMLSALMIDKLCAAINRIGLGETIKTSTFREKGIKPALKKVTPQLANASIYAIYDFEKAYDDAISKVGTKLPSESNKLRTLIATLEKFNVNYGKVNNALRQLDPQTAMPREITLGWLKEMDSSI